MLWPGGILWDRTMVRKWHLPKTAVLARTDGDFSLTGSRTSSYKYTGDFVFTLFTTYKFVRHQKSKVEVSDSETKCDTMYETVNVLTLKEILLTKQHPMWLRTVRYWEGGGSIGILCDNNYDAESDIFTNFNFTTNHQKYHIIPTSTKCVI